MDNVTKNAVILLSGGLDSTTVAAVAKAEERELYALTIDYNQRHRLELDAARRVAAFFGVRKHVIMPINLRLFGGSSLTDTLEVPKDIPLMEIGRSIPNTYVPGRNTVFLSLALAFAETIDATEIYLGVSAVDFSGYPDCGPEFVHAFEQLANIATKAGREAKPFAIRTPLIELSKKETIELGLSLGVDYSLTLTCYDPMPDGASCRRCESCLLRLDAFRQAGLTDPVRYALQGR